MDETNLLSLIKPWLDNIYQITTKRATVLFCIFDLNRPLDERSEHGIVSSRSKSEVILY
jgi:hypothetical protein